MSLVTCDPSKPLQLARVDLAKQKFACIFKQKVHDKMCFRGLPEVLGDDLTMTHCETCIEVTMTLPIVSVCVPNSHKEADNLKNRL
jgi:hypothetical protein